MRMARHFFSILFFCFFLVSATGASREGTGLERIKYNNPGLVVDMGVGLWAWPLPMDYDKDGDNDLVVSCNDDPSNGIYFFENASGDVKMPVFKLPLKISSRGWGDIQASYINGEVRLLLPRKELVDFYDKQTNFEKTVKIYPNPRIHGKVRANQWKYCDYEGDGDLDLIVGVGDWTEYGWDNAYDKTGNWTRGPLHGYVYLIRNNGSKDQPDYAEPVKLEATDQPIDVFGMPSPNFADFDGDGDMDLICGSFIGEITYFENIGADMEPIFAKGRALRYAGKDIRMDLCMIIPVGIDWDKDGDIDLIVGEEDGRVSFMENTGKVEDSLPVFMPPKFFQQEADEVKFGALVTPFSFDWDGDGDEDLICGNTAGYVGFIENLGEGDRPKWAKPVYLEADGEVIHIQAGYNGSIQGPAEKKWGYTTLSIADWDGDGLADIMINSIWGKVQWYRNIGTRKNPKLAAARPVEVEWEGKALKPAWLWWEPKGKELVTQWRTTPFMIDLNKDGLHDLVMLDHEGYLAFFERVKKDGGTTLLPGKRIFKGEDGNLLQLNPGTAGGSGRRKLCIVDWDLDGKDDLLLNERNVDFCRNISEKQGEYIFKNEGMVDERILAGHSTSPTVVDWDRNGVPDLLVGAEDGYFYYMKNPNAGR